ncbi:MAG: glycosyl transferase family 2 [Burkholderiales bacterium PBB3]|nr:MAG: glycosyl transferase family 2 [Burkholderiales bacterium PBB3]
MTSPQLVSVVVTTFNRNDALLAVLDGLIHQNDKNFEVVVADDGSRPEHVQAIQQSIAAKQLRVIHVWHPDVGFTLTRIRNRGVAATKGDYLVFLDGDCVPEVDFIARHRALAEAGRFISGSRVLLSEAFSQQVTENGEKISGRSLGYWIKKWLLGHANKLSGLVRLPDWSGRLDKGTPWTRVRGCNMALWRSDFEKVDGFDESFVGWGHEDADFVLRLHHAGVIRKNGFCATEVFHLWHKEAVRLQASQNAKTVEARALTNIVLPTLGYSQLRQGDDAVITRLG